MNNVKATKNVQVIMPLDLWHRIEERAHLLGLTTDAVISANLLSSFAAPAMKLDRAKWEALCDRIARQAPGPEPRIDLEKDKVAQKRLEELGLIGPARLPGIDQELAGDYP